MSAILIASTVAVLSTVPPGPYVVFREWPPKLVIEFSQPVVSHKIEILDDDGCKVSQGSEVGDQTRVVVQLRACARTGFPGGIMSVRWEVNGERGEYELRIRHHH